ncbi:hypothetical protein FKM82_001273 [Ascaphus truei]
MVIHTGLKSHQCPLCPFRCARKDNLKSHMKVHQHQDRGETFQCQLCPFTSSRHFSLKLHMRCHQHFLRTGAKVKEEPSEMDIKGSPFDDSLVNQDDENSSPAHGSLLPEALRQISTVVVSSLPIKEEPKDNDFPSVVPFTINSTDRPNSNSSMKLKDPLDFVACPSSLFSQDISVKMASDFLMKLSAASQKEPLTFTFKVKEEPNDEEPETPLSPQSSYTINHEAEARLSSTPDGDCKSQDTQSNLLTQDISVKAASELLMKLSAESCRDAQAVKIKEEPMEVDIPDSSVSPKHNLCYSTFGRQERNEHLQKLPECRVIPEGNLFSQDISVKMASELLFKLSEKVSKEHNHNKTNIIRTTSPFFSEEKCRQSPFTFNSKDLPKSESAPQGRTSLSDTESLGLDAGSGFSAWKLNEQLFPCNVCGKVFGRQQTLSRHLLLHTEERKYKCHLCPYAAKCRANLNQHLTVHSVKLVSTDTEDIVSAVISETSDKKKNPYYYRCPFCIYSTNRPAAMECHLKTHYKMEYKCRICKTVKANQLELEVHIREHRLGNHYKCDQCGYLSKTANKLIEHVRVHTGERPFHCDQCSYSCKRKDNLNLHKKLKHSPRQTFSCEECLFKTTHPFVFSRHIKKHQSSEFSEEEKKVQTTNRKEVTPLLTVNDSRSLLSPLSVMSASQALQTVAMSAAQSSGMEAHLALKAFAVNGISSGFDRYRNSEFAHLIPLTMLFPKNHYDVTFHPPRPQTAPPGATTPKHSFLAYLGLTERAETV